MTATNRWDQLLAEHKAREQGAPSPTNGAVHLIDPSRATAYAAAALESECAQLAAMAPDTGRNVALNEAAFRMGRHVGAGSIDAGTVRNALEHAAQQCRLPQTEIDTVLRDKPDSGINQGQQYPRHPAPRPDIPAVTVLALAPAPDQVTDFWAARPLLTHLHTYARARRVSPWAVLGVGLARITAAVPPFVTLPPIVGATASLNLFVGLVGTSGAGKGAAEGVAAEAIDLGQTRFARHTTGSGEGVAHAYMKRTKDGIDQHTTAVLFSVPEIDTLTALGGRQGATLLPELRRAWSGEDLGFAYADPSKRLPVPAHRYRMCLIAGIQPARAGTLLDDTDAGTPQRFLWLPAGDADAPDTAPDTPAPMLWKPPKCGFVNPAGHLHMDICDQARTTIETARLARLKGDGEALDGHALLTQLKTAAALALAEARLDVTDEDWQLADVISRMSAHTRSQVRATLTAKVADTNRARAEAEATRTVLVSERVGDAAVKRVCGVITRKLARVDDVSARDLRHAVASRDRQYVDEALERLQLAGQIEGQEVDRGDAGHGGSGVKFRASGAKK